MTEATPYYPHCPLRACNWQHNDPEPEGPNVRAAVLQAELSGHNERVRKAVRAHLETHTVEDFIYDISGYKVERDVMMENWQAALNHTLEQACQRLAEHARTLPAEERAAFEVAQRLVRQGIEEPGEQPGPRSDARQGPSA
ncbi:hypothetical protein ACFV1F_16995 [Streptomyces sp. NPDC059590]|uniref:hypothetical protein n=1 Tax=Streptomyces sp. NPDC059590 TaxID=3346877 RepID=UPI00367948F3